MGLSAMELDCALATKLVILWEATSLAQLLVMRSANGLGHASATESVSRLDTALETQLVLPSEEKSLVQLLVMGLARWLGHVSATESVSRLDSVLETQLVILWEATSLVQLLDGSSGLEIQPGWLLEDRLYLLVTPSEKLLGPT